MEANTVQIESANTVEICNYKFNNGWSIWFVAMFLIQVFNMKSKGLFSMDFNVQYKRNGMATKI